MSEKKKVWWIIAGADKRGPWDLDEIQEMLGKGLLGSADQLWREGLKNPMPLTALLGGAAPAAGDAAPQNLLHSENQPTAFPGTLADAIPERVYTLPLQRVYLPLAATALAIVALVVSLHFAVAAVIVTASVTLVAAGYVFAVRNSRLTLSPHAIVVRELWGSETCARTSLRESRGKVLVFDQGRAVLLAPFAGDSILDRLPDTWPDDFPARPAADNATVSFIAAHVILAFALVPGSNLGHTLYLPSWQILPAALMPLLGLLLILFYPERISLYRAKVRPDTLPAHLLFVAPLFVLFNGEGIINGGSAMTMGSYLSVGLLLLLLLGDRKLRESWLVCLVMAIVVWADGVGMIIPINTFADTAPTAHTTGQLTYMDHFKRDDGFHYTIITNDPRLPTGSLYTDRQLMDPGVEPNARWAGYSTEPRKPVPLNITLHTGLLGLRWGELDYSPDTP